MSNDQLEKALAAVSSGSWEIAHDPQSGAEVRCIATFGPREDTGIRIGLTASGEWVAVGPQRCTRIAPDSAAWLIALDYDLAELRDLISRRLVDAAVADTVFDALPRESIVLQALKYGNDPGVSKGISWVEQDRALLTGSIRDALENVSRDRHFSQAVRHRAARLAAPLRGMRH